MEHESFDNEAVARILNQFFISIKVDREQHPDIDETYMTAITMMTGRGGWPMSSFITHEGKTFWGGTYFPAEQFKQLLLGVHEAWLNKRSEIESQAQRVASAVAQLNDAKRQSAKIDARIIAQATDTILAGFDPVSGGFTPAPNFPNEPELFLLIDQIKRTGNHKLLNALEITLNAMAQGGIYDQVGGGFHRYSTDTQWLVPHFEKMLYNQAHLSRVYLQAYELTDNPFYARIARQTLDYVLRDMRSDEGGFYSASDADSEGKEGVFYVWTPREIKMALSADDAKLAIELFGVTEAGNFESKNILHLPLSLIDFAKTHQLTQAELLQKIDLILQQLRKVREKRIHPFRDDKIITAWNGMMITTLAEASEQLNEPRYLAAAERNDQFIWQYNHTENGNLFRVHLNNSSSIKASQEDYAYLAEAMLALYDVTQKPAYLDKAKSLLATMTSQFWDQKGGGFFMGVKSTVPTMARPKQSSDGAIPSGNSVAVNVLAMLNRREANYEDKLKAEQTISAFYQQIAAHPSAYSYMLLGVNKLLKAETGARQYAAKGAVSIQGQIINQNKENRLLLSIKIKPGWHINAVKPLEKDLIPTEIQISNTGQWNLSQISYPKASEKKLAFSQKPLALYEGNIQITATINKSAETKDTLFPVQLQLQACNEKSCLAPEVVKFKLSNHRP